MPLMPAGFLPGTPIPARATCPTCDAGPMDKHRVVDEEPTMDELREWTFDSVCRATDGCEPVEPDGTCAHGHRSWLLHLGLA